jgi:hypothetical protein
MAFTLCTVSGKVYLALGSSAPTQCGGTLRVEIVDANGNPSSAAVSDGTNTHRFGGYIDTTISDSTGVSFKIPQGSQFTAGTRIKATYIITTPTSMTWSEYWTIPDTATADIGNLAT